MAQKRTVDAATEPISTAEAKSFMRVTSTADDTLIGVLIKNARQLCENYSGRAFISQTWEFSLDRFPSTQSGSGSRPWWDGTREGPISLLNRTEDFLELPVGPLISVSSLKTFDFSNTEATMDASDYIVDTRRMPPRITLALGSIWPVNLRPADAVLVTFLAGYANAAAVPGPLTQAVYQTTSFLYENRESTPELPAGVMALLDPYRLKRIA